MYVNEKYYKNVRRKSEGEKLLRRPRLKWEDNITPSVDVREVGFNNVH
jgi:hypothetical protein